MKRQLILLGLSALALASCQKNAPQEITESAGENARGLTVMAFTPGSLIDPSPTTETKNLYGKLKKTALTGVLFGHHDDRVIGIDTNNVEWKYDTGHLFNSDVKYMVNEYPAVNAYGISNIELGTVTYNSDGVPFRYIAKTARAAYSQGSLISILWACRNPVYPEYDMKAHIDSGVTNTISHFFDGSDPHHAEYVARYQGYMDKFAKFVKDSLKGPGGEPIPILFRTLHEQNGSWFWWGASQTTAFDYKKFWKYTVDYLRNTAHLHNLIYVYAPGNFADATAYNSTYPGDDYIDILSADIYDGSSYGAGAFLTAANNMVQIMKTKAQGALKPFAISETGLNLVPKADWWTQTYKPMVKGKGMAYAVVWRNTRNNGIPANQPGGDSYYCAYRGQLSANNFRTMHLDTAMYFLTKAQAKHMYQP
jgi:mannan endo-1,4-beta-mannosidase